MASSGYCYSNISSNNHQMFDTNHDSIYNVATDLTGFHQKNMNSSDSGIWQDDDPSMRCVFPCEPNERPSQGLSLSLSSTNPSTIGLQSFELRNHDDTRFQNQIQIQNQMMVDHHNNQVGFMMRNSKYLGPAQQLLNEFCNLGIRQGDVQLQKKNKQQKMNQWQDESGSSSLKHPSDLHSLELLEFQKRKSKLLQMLEEVDKRYQHYRHQMKAVVSSFEAVAGNGAATVYSDLASKAMSRHFRCLRDGIVGQIKATKRAMGDKDMMIPGSTRGETPRLRVLDQTLRQQRAFQQMSLMETHPWRPQRGLPERSVSVLRSWLFEHFLHPYPSDVDKHILARQTGLSRSQVSNWFINARVRLWKPMVEEMYIEETKDEENMSTFSDEFAALDKNIVSRQTHNLHSMADQDHKPTPDQLVRIDSECLSSIINHSADPKNSKLNIHQSHDHMHHQNFGRVGGTNESFGAIELDFSTYNHNSGAGSCYGSGVSGGGVSLTLGLQQQTSLLYGGRDPMEEVQYNLMDGEAQNLPYRNLMGAQLLHDLV